MRRWLSYKPSSKFSNNNWTGSGASCSGEKSEKRLDLDPVEQGNLLTGLGVETPPVLDEPSTQTVTYERRNKVRDGAVNDSGLRFDASVPVKTIEVKDPAIEAIPENLREVIGEKVSYRLAQQPGSHVVLKYVRPVVKRKDTLAIVTAAAPGQVLERTAAEVSFLAGMLVDKFRYHLPLYRQHQRLGEPRHRGEPFEPEYLGEPGHRSA